MQDDLRVGVGGEDVPFFRQLLFQGREVVDLAVVDQDQSMVFVLDGLLSIVQADDRQPPHPQAGHLVAIKARFVGAPGIDALHHIADRFFPVIRVVF